MELSDQGGLVRVARIGKPHGIRGEVTVQVFTDSPDTRFAVGEVLRLPEFSATPTTYDALTVEHARWNKKILLLKFEEFSNRNIAESLRDAELYAPAEDPLGDETGWYAKELIGLAVYEDNLDSEQIGEVTNLITGASQDLLEISLTDGCEVLIPFVEEIVPEINEKLGAVIITPPPGLLELNRS